MVKKKIAIIGLGIAGLHLAYALKNEDLCEVSVFTNKTAKEVRTGRIPSTQTHFQQILNSEKLFRIPDYGPVHEIKKMELRFNDSMAIKGHLEERAVTLDQRIYLAALIDNLKALKIQHENKRIHSADLQRLASEFDLIVDCTGKIGPIGSFHNYSELEMPEKPLRVCSAGFFHGITPDEDNKMCINVIPGQGELFEVSTYTGHGVVRTFLLEALPGSELDCIKTNDPTLFAKSMLGMLEKFFPTIHSRTDKDNFRLIDDNAFIRTAIKPELRIPYHMIHDTLLIGCGDCVALNDPITGQGANTASYCAGQLYQVIKENVENKWSIELGELYWDRTKEYVVKVTEWTNSMLKPYSSSFAAMLGEASQNQKAADTLVNLFTNPIGAHRLFFSNN